MIKTKLDIEQDVYDVANKFLKGLISGKVYKPDCRPQDSQKEDCVIRVSFATADQIQRGTFYINIFVPDIDNGRGYFTPDTKRLREIASKDMPLLEAFSNAYKDYDFALGSATDCLQVYNAHQHFVSINISFNRITF